MSQWPQFQYTYDGSFAGFLCCVYESYVRRELPVCFATGSAGDFAAGAVSLLDKLGCVDGLCFGSESGDISLFEKTATLLQCESAAFSDALKKALKSGLSFPAARQQALLLCLDMAKDMPSTACPDNNSTAEQTVALLSSPNNLLGLEYTLALLRRNSSIRPFTISRVGSGYHDPLGGAADFPSASALRSLLAKQGKQALLSQLQCYPELQPLLPLWEEVLSQNTFLFSNDLSSPLHYRLLTAAPGSFGTYAEVGKELADKLVTAHTVDPAAARDALLHTMACKAAIKGGWKSDLSELRVLVDKVQSGEVQFCPHGRPVKAKLTKYELEKMFKRA